jgi:hypothetical protein
MILGLTQKMHHVKFLLNANSPAILTGVGVAGTVTTAYLTGRASFKASRIIENEELIVNNSVEIESDRVYLTKKNKVKLVWKLYIPAVGVGSTTIASIILANKISSKRLAALGVAAGISERALQEYKEKVLEKIGDRQERNIRDEIAQDRITKNPVNTREVILAGTGEVLCYDMGTGRYFQSTVEEIKRAENKINHQLIHFMSASLSEFFDEIGLPPTTYSDSVGWNMNSTVEVVFSTTMTPDQRPCIAIDFAKPPIPDYEKKMWD